MDFILRSWTSEDLDALVKYANNPHIARNMSEGFPHPYTREDGQRYIGRVSQDRPLQVFAISMGDEPIGSIGIFPETDRPGNNAAIAYWLAEPFWGKGIMTKAIRQMVDYGFKTFNIDRIYAKPYGMNSASHRVLEKAGFTLEKKLQRSVMKGDEYLDEIVYAINRGRKVPGS